MLCCRAWLCQAFGHWVTILGEDRAPGEKECHIRWRCPNCGQEARVRSASLEQARARQSRTVALVSGAALFALVAVVEALAT